MTLEGELFFYFETGTEGGYWAFQDNKYPTSHEGLHVLKNGDKLVITHPNEKTIVWEGVIDLIEHKAFTENASGMWIHADQKGISRDEWASYFFKEFLAELTKAQ